MKKLLIISIFLMILNSCYKNNVEKNIILKIGQLELTKYEIEKNKNLFLIKNKSDSIGLNAPDRIIKWKNDYIDHCFIVADAYEKKYDTIASIKKQIKYTGNYMMAQRYGYLWQKTISPIVDREKIVTEEKLRKRKKLYYFEYISSNGSDSLSCNIFNGTIIKSKEDFSNFKHKAHLIKSISTGYFSIQWPFMGFWDYKEYLYNMKEGDVSKLLITNNKNTFLYLDHIEEIPLNDLEKKSISTELQLGTEEELIKQTDIERDAKCQPILNKNNIDVIGQFLNKGNSILLFSNNLELIKYNINDSVRVVKFKTFLEYYSYQPMRMLIKNKEMLSDYVMEYYKDDYLLNEAKKINLYNSPIFILDQKNFLNNVLYGNYIEKEIVKKISIDSTEIINFYKNNLQQFVQPQNVKVNIYTFSDIETAQRNQNTISELLKQNEISKTGDSTIIRGLIKYTPGVDIDMESKEHSKNLKNIILETKLGTLSSYPVLNNDRYIFVYKEKEEGRCYRKFDEVSDQIKKLLKMQKIEIDKRTLVEKLKSKYKIEIDKIEI